MKQLSKQNKRNSRNSPWRKLPLSAKSARCLEYFAKLEAAGDSRRIPRPELDDQS